MTFGEWIKMGAETVRYTKKDDTHTVIEHKDEKGNITTETVLTPPPTPHQDAVNLAAGKLNAKEEARAEEVLTSPELLTNLKKEVGKKVVGEKDSIHTILLTAAGALYVKEQTPPTYTLVANSLSNTGKDYTVRNTLALFPKDKVIHRTRISERALTYWHNAKYEPSWTWDNKILYLSDVSNTVLNCEVIKCMVTEGSTATIVINHMAIDIEIKGKPGIICTIMRASPSEETLGRFPFMTLDETQEQTALIMEKQASAAARGDKISTEYDKDLLNALKILEPVKVIIPYAEMLPPFFDKRSVIMRRNFDRVLKYIAASAALHQRQRKRNDKGEVLAEPRDYDNAAIAIRKIASNAALVPLTREDKSIIEYALSVDNFSAAEVSTHVPLGKTALYEHLDKLSEHKLLIKEHTKDTYGTRYLYRAAEEATYKVEIPSFSAFSAFSACPERAKMSQEQQKTQENVYFDGIGGTAKQANKTNQANKEEETIYDKIILALKPLPSGLTANDLLSLFPEEIRGKAHEEIKLRINKGDLTQLANGCLTL